MTLLELERRMANAVMQPLTSRYGMQKRTAEGKSMPAEAARLIKPNKRLTSFERLEIYNRQYWFRILSAFSEDFPALQATVGKKRFDAIAQAYLAENPSRSFTLRNLGSRLESWLRDNPKWAGPRHAVALDVVRVEWAYIEAFDNAEEPALTLADLADLGSGSCLSLQPHVRLLRLGFPVDDFIIDVHRRQTASDVASNAVTRAARPGKKNHLSVLAPSEIFLAVHRLDHLVYYKRLEPEAYRLLESLRNGLPLDAAIESAFEGSRMALPERPTSVRQWFTGWAELGWFCRHHKARTQPTTRKKK